jgi:hypothetical protein
VGGGSGKQVEGKRERKDLGSVRLWFAARISNNGRWNVSPPSGRYIGFAPSHSLSLAWAAHFCGGPLSSEYLFWTEMGHGPIYHIKTWAFVVEY